MVSVRDRKEQVKFAMSFGLSQRRACTLLDISRSSLYYIYKSPQKEEAIIDAMRSLANQYPRYGYRRIHIFLQREGINLGIERCGRLWSKLGLQVPKKKRRKVIHSGDHLCAATGPHAVWSYDFVHGMCANGQKIKCLTVVDEYTRECLAIEVAGTIRSNQVVDTLSRLMSLHGVPRYLRSDNGPEFVSNALLGWAKEARLEVIFIEPGKPWQNGKNESFNGKFRDECLSMEWFRNRLEAKVIIEDWRQHYNHVRPHSSLSYLTPNEFKFSLCNVTTGAFVSI